MNFFFIFIFNVVFRTSCSLNNSFSQMHQRSVASELAVYFNFGFSGFNMDSSSISQYALTDLLTHLRNSVTVGAFNQEASQKSENLTISKLEIDEIVFVNNTLPESKTKYDFKITFKVFHTSSTVTSAAFEDIDKIAMKMFEKITKTSFVPEFECSPCFVKPDFQATCARQHICGIVSLY